MVRLQAEECRRSGSTMFRSAPRPERRTVQRPGTSGEGPMPVSSCLPISPFISFMIGRNGATGSRYMV